MPNIKSQIARLKTNERNTELNRVRKSKLKSEVKKFETAIETKNPSEMAEAMKNVSKALDSTARKGAIHKNKAARAKSRLQKKINKTLESNKK